MTDPRRDTAGDYGYDMAHVDMAGERTADEGTTPGRAGAAGAGETPPERPAGPGAAGASDRGGDYGYDEAHGF